MRGQPANSPDTNVLDLGFFRSLQSDYHKIKRAKDIDGLIANALQAWNKYDPFKLAKIWVSHQAVCDEILCCYGDNDYTLPHLGKDKKENHHKLPDRIKASARAIQIAKEVVEI